MGREVRRVPANWEHPKDEKGDYIPLLGDIYSARLFDYDRQAAKWAEGLRQDYLTQLWIPIEEKYAGMTFEEFTGARPVESDYMPDWPEAERTHYQMYEDTSEGTPISPVFATPEEVARWCADNGASAFAGQTASYEAWLRAAKGGFAPSMIMQNGVLESGVEALKDEKP